MYFGKDYKNIFLKKKTITGKLYTCSILIFISNNT